MIFPQPVAWTIAGCCVLITLIVIWDEIRTEVRFRAWQKREGIYEQEHKRKEEIR